MDDIILVDTEDREIGRGEKMAVHRAGLLHRAFSVFLFCGDSVLLQKRAASKYHCGGLWTNTCCSHPRPGETVADAAVRRLREELGIETGGLTEAASFIYRYPFENGLTEYEYDHVLVGEYDGGWTENPEEVDAVKLVPLADLRAELLRTPGQFTPWFLTVFGFAEKGRG